MHTRPASLVACCLSSFSIDLQSSTEHMRVAVQYAASICLYQVLTLSVLREVPPSPAFSALLPPIRHKRLSVLAAATQNRAHLCRDTCLALFCHRCCLSVPRRLEIAQAHTNCAPYALYNSCEKCNSYAHNNPCDKCKHTNTMPQI